MSSISTHLFEAEFFGHTRGAFTGALAPRTGFLEHTHRGTLFLDEIGDLPLALQGKLLRVLQEGEFSRVGSSERVMVDLRFIAATNEDLDRMISRKAFRKDLYYRIRGGWLHLPPLRERLEDIPPLVNAFLGKYDEYPRGSQHLTPAAMDRLQAYQWPGNVRELKSMLQSAINLARGKVIDLVHLPEHVRSLPAINPPVSGKSGSSPIQPLAAVEQDHILKVYALCGRNKSHAAKALGIGLNTLRRKLAAYGVE